MLFLCYSRCSTCQKAREWLEARNMEFDVRDIKEKRPTEKELREWHAASGLPLKRFFNTSGLLYKALELRDKLPAMTEDEQLRLLASDGMLVKRPIVVSGGRVLVGFNAKEWEQELSI